ncbi:hypothetical protein GCM10010468_70840 [Actinocorallia longicatena]|uniref:Uncharacterized protein n=1 Tax=Actinocorallia longicatena TaxID=111803 RepID=A0ABP6QLA3_9ACTN
MRYIRCPLPNGQATNRPPVSPASPMYPRVTCAPATYTCPTTPGVTGCSRSSSTYSAVPGSPRPMTLPDSVPVSSRWVECTVVSVIPYMLTSRGPAPVRQPATRDGSSASPPNTTSRTDGGGPAWTAWSWEKPDGVWLRTVTPSRSTSRANSSGLRDTS